MNTAAPMNAIVVITCRSMVSARSIHGQHAAAHARPTALPNTAQSRSALHPKAPMRRNLWYRLRANCPAGEPLHNSDDASAIKAPLPVHMARTSVAAVSSNVPIGNQTTGGAR